MLCPLVIFAKQENYVEDNKENNVFLEIFSIALLSVRNLQSQRW